jgi:hypothetical protein
MPSESQTHRLHSAHEISPRALFSSSSRFCSSPAAAPAAAARRDDRLSRLWGSTGGIGALVGLGDGSMNVLSPN